MVIACLITMRLSDCFVSCKEMRKGRGACAANEMWVAMTTHKSAPAECTTVAIDKIYLPEILCKNCIDTS